MNKRKREDVKVGTRFVYVLDKGESRSLSPGWTPAMPWSGDHYEFIGWDDDAAIMRHLNGNTALTHLLLDPISWVEVVTAPPMPQAINLLTENLEVVANELRLRDRKIQDLEASVRVITENFCSEQNYRNRILELEKKNGELEAKIASILAASKEEKAHLQKTLDERTQRIDQLWRERITADNRLADFKAELKEFYNSLCG